MADILSGDLRAVQVVAVLQLIEAEALTGRLQLGRDEVVFSEGRPLSATTGSHEGVEAIRRLVERRQGRFRFLEEESVQGTPLGSVMSLVMQSLRLQDDWLQLRGRFLGRAEAGRTMPPRRSLAVIWEQLDGTRTLAEVVLGVDASVASMVDDLKDAVERRWVVDKAAPDLQRAARAEERALLLAAQDQDQDRRVPGAMPAQVADQRGRRGSPAQRGDSSRTRPRIAVQEEPRRAAPARAPEVAPVDVAPVAEAPTGRAGNVARERTYSSLLAEAQSLLEAERWHDAEPLLREALAAKPGDRVVMSVLTRVQSVVRRADAHSDPVPRMEGSSPWR